MKPYNTVTDNTIKILISCLLLTSFLTMQAFPDRRVSSFSYVGVLPYYAEHRSIYVALYQTKSGDYTQSADYADVGGARLPHEKYTAHTAARIFFPLQQHKNRLTQILDWPTKQYMAQMIFRGAWQRGTLMDMADGRYTYLLNVDRRVSLKNLNVFPMIIVPLQNLLDSIGAAREKDDFHAITITDTKGNSFLLQESFARGLARSENWNLLQEL